MAKKKKEIENELESPAVEPQAEVNEPSVQPKPEPHDWRNDYESHPKFAKFKKGVK